MSFGLAQVTMVIGPAAGGLLIAGSGIASAYALDAVTCLGMWAAAHAMSPQPPATVEHREPVLASIRVGPGVRAPLAVAHRELRDRPGGDGFGMPRALFPVLAVSVFHAGPEGAGPAAGGGLRRRNRRGAHDGLAPGGALPGPDRAGGGGGVGAGDRGGRPMTRLWPAAALFAVAGAADSISAVCRTTIMQSVTPDHMRGRMSSVFILVVTSGPRLGDVESGTVAALTTPQVSVVSGGLACLGAVALVAVLLPDLVRYDAAEMASLGAEPA